MNKEAIIKSTLNRMKQLPLDRLQEVSDFTEFLLNKSEDQLVSEGIAAMIEESETFHFLNDEEELYGPEDIKIPNS